MLFALLLAKRFIPWPWHTTSDPGDSFKRLVCKGWQCGSRSNYPEHQIDEFSDLIDAYENKSINTEFERKIRFLIRRGYDPALCLAGFLEMLGLGFQQNMTESYEFLSKGIGKDLWACHEAMSFHPMAQNVTHHIIKGSQNGGIWSMIRRALTTKNTTESLALLQHLATAATSNWWKKRRSGLDYADAVGAVLKLNNKPLDVAWKTLEDLSHRGNLPAAIWVAEGIQTGEIGRRNETEAIEILKPFILNSVWVVDLSSMLKSTDKFDRSRVIRIAKELGNKFAVRMESYPELFE